MIIKNILIILGTFCIHDQMKDHDFSYLLVISVKNVNIKLFSVVLPHIVLFRFEAKYKLGLKLNLDIDPDSFSFH